VPRLPSRVRVSLKIVALPDGVVSKPTKPAERRVLNVAFEKGEITELPAAFHPNTC
jgi:hypothetical protein